MQVNMTIIISMQLKYISTFQHHSIRLPNSDINVTAFKKMAAIVGAFTRHISEISTITDNNEFDYLINHIFSCPLRSEHGEQQSKIALTLLIKILFVFLQNFSAH